MDHGYPAFLNLLSQPGAIIHSLPKDNVYGPIAHYAHALPLEQVGLFIRAVVTSPSLWSNHTWSHLMGVRASLRQSVHLKVSTLKKVMPSGFIFGPDLASPLVAWADAVLQGSSSAHTTFEQIHASIAILCGLSLGLQDVRPDISSVGTRVKKIGGELASLCSDVINFQFSADKSVWGNEFKAADSAKELTLCLLAQSLPTVQSELLVPLDLESIIRMGRESVQQTYREGHYLDFTVAARRDSQGHVNIPDSVEQLKQLTAMNARLVYTNIGPICQLIAKCTHLLAIRDLSSAWTAMEDVIHVCELLCCNIDTVWSSSCSSAVLSEHEADGHQNQIMLAVWQSLKTLLFSMLIIGQSCVTFCAWHRPTQSVRQPAVAASRVACAIIRMLHHLSFVGSRFGTMASDVSGIPELRRTFFGALDIVSTNSVICEELLTSLSVMGGDDLELWHPVRQSRAAYFLACAEQLIPRVSDQLTEQLLIPSAQRYLDLPLQRETFEAAHSVILAVFANNGVRERVQGVRDQRDRLTTRLAPFYLKSLFYNSPEGRLSSEQFKLAFSSLVRSLSASTEDALAWNCIDALLDALHSSHAGSLTHGSEQERLERTLISTISAVNLSLLSKLLSVVEGELIIPKGSLYMRDIAEQIVSHVGDEQKDVAVAWWLDVRGRWRNTATQPNL